MQDNIFHAEAFGVNMNIIRDVKKILPLHNIEQCDV